MSTKFLKKNVTIHVLPWVLAFLCFSVGQKAFAADKPYAGTKIKYMAVAEPISDYIRSDILPKFKEETGIDVEMDTTDYVKLHDKQVLELLAGKYDVYQVDQM